MMIDEYVAEQLVSENLPDFGTQRCLFEKKLKQPCLEKKI